MCWADLPAAAVFPARWSMNWSYRAQPFSSAAYPIAGAQTIGTGVCNSVHPKQISFGYS
jgi:hypothetical protein